MTHLGGGLAPPCSSYIVKALVGRINDSISGRKFDLLNTHLRSNK